VYQPSGEPARETLEAPAPVTLHREPSEWTPRMRPLRQWAMPTAIAVLCVAVVATTSWGVIARNDLGAARKTVTDQSKQLAAQATRLAGLQAALNEYQDRLAATQSDLTSKQSDLASTDKTLSLCKSIISLDWPSADLARQIGLIWRNAQGTLTYEQFGRQVGQALTQFGSQPTSVALSDIRDCLPSS
jgi:hypothetical protein